MASKLYPPYINGTLPAFWLTYDPSNTVVIGAAITIPFSDNPAKTGIITGYSLRLRTASSGSYLFEPIFSGSASVENNTITFVLNQTQASKLKEGQYYKAQIAYCGDSQTDIGYYSTVGVIKCTSKPTVSITNLALENINFFTNEFIGLYDTSNCKDQSEKVYSYSFKMYDELGNIYYDTGELLHNASYDTEYGYSLDRLLVNEFVATDTTFSIQYSVTTLNGLELSTGLYKLTNEGFNPPSKNIEIYPESNLDNGYITIHFKGDLDKERSYYYVLNEDILINEKDNEGNYLKDRNKKTVYQKIIEGVSANNSHILFMKNSNVYRYYDKGFDDQYIYANRDKTFTDNMQSIEINGKTYYYDGELISMPSYYYIDYKRENDELIAFQSAEAHTEQWLQKNRKEKFLDTNNNPVQGDQIITTPLLYLIATGKELAKSLTYQYIEDNNYYENENGKLQSGNSVYYIIDKEPYEAFYYGAYLLSRASDADNYTTWVNISRFRLEEQPPSSYSIKDFTIEHGRKYMYAVQQYNIWGLYSTRIVSDIFEAGFEDAFLYDGERCLKIRFNPEVSSFKTTILEQKTDTIGGRFPYITRNGETYYKEFPIGGLIAAEMDEEELFIKRGVVTSHRHSTSAIEANEPKNAIRDYHMFSDENIMLEREFKLAVLDWLNNGQPKLFKSPYEGNYIVRLMNTSLTPVKELGRMLHSFTTTAYEIAEFNYQNLLQFGFLDTSAPTDYVGLWRTYNLADYPSGQDINITFDVGLMSFSVQDLMPGDIIRVIYGDGDLPEYEDIMIGITGAYMCAGINRTIKGIHIPARPGASSYTGDKNGTQYTGVINCYYQGLRITAFDAITGMQLRTIPSYQFIGVDPRLEEMKTMNWNEKNNYDLFVRGLSQTEFRNFQGYTIRDYIDRMIEKKDKDTTGSDLYYIGDEGMKYIASFDPGELIDRINATINLGESDKIKMLKLEQGHFRLRELVPVYAQNSRQYFNERKEQQDTWMVSVSPFGYPHPIEELTLFEMIDPFCIFEVFQLQEGRWTPVNGFYGSPYYDPYYKSWLYDYEPYFQMNYQMRKICLVNESDPEIKPYRRDELTFVTDSETGEQYYMFNTSIIPESRIYDIDIIAESDSSYYYIDKNNEKIYLDKYNYYEDNATFQLVTLNAVPTENKIYYIKDYDNNIDLSIVKEKIYKDFEGINSIHIGNGVMAELTFQIKVIDYYTEIADPEVAAAKAAYLKKSQFYKTLMQTYAIIDKAANTNKKYGALSALYERLLQGKTTGLGNMTAEQVDTIEALLSRPADKADLELFSIYNTLMIPNTLGTELTDTLLNFFEEDPTHLQETIKNSETVKNAKDLLNNILIYNDNYFKYNIVDLNQEIYQTLTELDLQTTLFDDDTTPTYAVDPEKITLKNINNYNFYKYVIASTGETYYYFIKKSDIQTYYESNPSLIKANIAFDPEGHPIKNINRLDGVVVQLLSKADYESLYNEQLQMYNQEEYEEIKESDTCLWIKYFDDTILHEENEINIILNSGSTTQGAQNKLDIIDAEIEEFSNIVEDYATKIANVDSQYLEIYNNLKNAIDAYNNRAYYFWGLNEFYKIVNAEDPNTKVVIPLQDYLANVERNINSRTIGIDNGMGQITALLEKVKQTFSSNKQKILLYSTINEDKSNDQLLDEYHDEQIASAKGQILLMIFEYYFIGLRILYLLNKYWNNLSSETIVKYINTYKEVQAEFMEILELCVDEDNCLIDQNNHTYKFKSDYEQGFYMYYNELVANAKDQAAQLRAQWQSQGSLDLKAHTALVLLLDQISFMNYIGNNGIYEGNVKAYPLILGSNLTIEFTYNNNFIRYNINPIMQNNDFNFIRSFNQKLKTVDENLSIASYTNNRQFIFIDNSTISADLRDINFFRYGTQSYMHPVYRELINSLYDNTHSYFSELTKQGYDNYSSERISQIYWCDNRAIVIVNDHLKGESTSSFIYNPLKDYGYTYAFEKISYNPRQKYYIKNNSSYSLIGEVSEEDYNSDSAPEYYIDDGTGNDYLPVHNKIDITTYDATGLYYYNEGVYEEAQSPLSENVKYYTRVFIGNKIYFDSLIDNPNKQETILNISHSAVVMLQKIVNGLMNYFATTPAAMIKASLNYNQNYLTQIQKSLDISDLPIAFGMQNTDDPLQKAVTDALAEYNTLVIGYQQALKDSPQYKAKITEFNNIYYPDGNSPYNIDEYYSLKLQSLDNPDLTYIYQSDADFNSQSNFSINDRAIISRYGTTESPIVPIYLIDPKFLEFFTSIAELDNQLNDIGLAYWYKQILSQEKLKKYQELLQQALELKELYQKQYDNYYDKFNKYKAEAEQSQKIYSSYTGTDELEYYLDKSTNKKTIEEIREEVRDAWWAFLNILDEKYTAEKARGMYV